MKSKALRMSDDCYRNVLLLAETHSPTCSSENEAITAAIRYAAVHMTIDDMSQAIRSERNARARELLAERIARKVATTRCSYCGADVTRVDAPQEDDVEAWAAQAIEHYSECEWIETKAHSLPAR